MTTSFFFLNMYVSMHLCSKASLLPGVAHSFVVTPVELITQPRNVSGVTVCLFECFLWFPGEKAHRRSDQQESFRYEQAFSVHELGSNCFKNW